MKVKELRLEQLIPTILLKLTEKEFKAVEAEMQYRMKIIGNISKAKYQR